jgi:hypothetical protein
MTMTTTAPDNVTAFEDAANSRWLAERLAPARARVQQEPTEDAVERIRARVFGDRAARKKQRKIAA